jgi:hypothetical protein
MTVDRRRLLAGVPAAVVGSALFAGAATACSKAGPEKAGPENASSVTGPEVHWRMMVSWPKDLSIMARSPGVARWAGTAAGVYCLLYAVAGAVIGMAAKCCCLRWSPATTRLPNSSRCSCHRCSPASFWPPLWPR